MRDRLVPEYPVARSVLENAEEAVTWGVADAIAWSGTQPELVDWKNNVNPSPDTIDWYRNQVNAYLRDRRADRSDGVPDERSGRVWGGEAWS